MRYKVGDRVKVKGDLIPENQYGDLLFIKEMVKYSGKWVNIVGMEDGENIIKEDSNRWRWTDEMFEGDVQQTIE